MPCRDRHCNWRGRRAFHLLVEPVTAPGLDQLVEHHRKNLGEMGDVADGIVDLALVERTTAPVGKARAFIELKADPRLDEVRIADLFGLDRKSTRLNSSH